ncbi:MAG: tRNA (N6-threonylcarbamoyladenosine(37)-N6)-methyltransferase TrmO [Myxococcales bacterium]|nr:tRNA (N6-threonylcarbamoyladenosine(37)-N6)-methyltransferase TrmO [Myxococcales bacterium]
MVLEPIGVLRSPFVDRAEAPRQPRAGEGVEARIECFETFAGRDGAAPQSLERALYDLDGWEFLWVLFWFHKNAGWRPQVLPPRSDRRRGVFSTRSPHRPNPLGLSVVRLLSVEKRTLRIAGCDMLDGTPVLDIKPYVPWSDAIPTAKTGWLAPPEYVADLAEDGRPNDPKSATPVRFGPVARAQLDWLAERGETELESRIIRALSLGTKAHPYRRIQRDGDAHKLAVKAWRARFEDLGADGCVVLSIKSGYREDALGDDPSLEVHRAFVAQFGLEFSA